MGWLRRATRWRRSPRGNVAGEEGAQFLGADMSTKLKLMGVDVASIGDAHGATLNALNYVYTDEAAGVYKRLVISGDRKYLLGAILVGGADEIRQSPADGAEPSAVARAPRRPDPAGARRREEGPRVDLLPASAAICNLQQREQGRAVRCDRRRLREPRRAEEATKASTTCAAAARS